ncbi:MAG: hypothetical protein M0R32_10830, partial [Candidatus Cloacimonetes bacterium]|nr:hypothetical protein [Candidatus Cloacimonadota bacterium]
PLLSIQAKSLKILSPCHFVTIQTALKSSKPSERPGRAQNKNSRDPKPGMQNHFGLDIYRLCTG